MSVIEAFPDGVVQLRNVFGDADHLCAEFHFAGTHTGPLKTPGGDVPPTNARVEFPYIIAYEYEGDLAKEVREYYDQLELLLPLGLMKPAG